MMAKARCSLHAIDLAATGQCDECSKLVAVKTLTAVSMFDDDEGKYQRWLDGHRHGYVMNILRGLNPREAKMHCADCDSISDPTTPYVTRDYVKVCADRRADLDEWAMREVGSKIPLCQNCFGF